MAWHRLVNNGVASSIRSSTTFRPTYLGLELRVVVEELTELHGGEGVEQILGGKRIAVTGGAQGIGEASVRAMARHGARVLVADLDGDKAEAVAADIRSQGGDAIACSINVVVADQCKAMIELMVTTWGGIDVLFACAGVLRALTVPDTPEDVWDQIMDINVKGTFLCCKYAIPVMAKQKEGVIINVASGAALAANRNLAAYSASKAAVLLLTKCIAADHAGEGIRANCVCPGAIDTQMIRTDFEKSGNSVDARAELERAHVLGRLGKPEEVAELVCFMASDRNSFMTGTPVIFDGGFTLLGNRNA